MTANVKCTVFVCWMIAMRLVFSPAHSPLWRDLLGAAVWGFAGWAISNWLVSKSS